MTQTKYERTTGIETIPHETELDKGSLKGTFVSVLLLGGFIICSWVAVFLLFIDRT